MEPPPLSSASPFSSRRIGGGRDSNLPLVGGKLHLTKANDIRLEKPEMGTPRDVDHVHSMQLRVVACLPAFYGLTTD